MAAIAAWDIAASLDLVSNQALPEPIPVFGRLFELLATQTLWNEVWPTLGGWVSGLGLAMLVAVPLGIFLGRNSFAFRSGRFAIDFLRTIPVLGIIPLAALLFGTSRITELVVVVPACIWPLLLQTIYGAREVDPMALETARSFRIGWKRTMLRVILPSATPFIATGLRIAAVMAMLLAISIELLVSVPGVGRGLALAQQNGATLDVYAYTIVAGLLGYGVAQLFAKLERVFIHWHASQRSAR